jgi:hypothetical protein
MSQNKEPCEARAAEEVGATFGRTSETLMPNGPELKIELICDTCHACSHVLLGKLFM